MFLRVIGIISIFITAGWGNNWIETTQKDFSDGTFEHNLYASFRNGPDRSPGDVEFVPRWDYNQDGFGDVTSSTVGAGYIGGDPSRDPCIIYLGGPEGFDPARKLEYRIGSVGAMCGADLNRDGFTDLVGAIIYFYPPDTSVKPGGLAIFWGTASGPDSNNVTTLGNPNNHGEAFYIADLNKDGYLDIVYASYSSYSDFAIIWGSPNGYSNDNVTVIMVNDGGIPRHNFEVADMDKDGYLDIIVTCFHFWGSPTPRPSWKIFWGSSAGYSETDFTHLQAFGVQAHGLSVADLNNDGWLDLVGTTYRSGSADPGPDNSMVWFGKANRQFQDPVLLSPGNCFGGSIIADLYPLGDPDGWLDIIFLSGNISTEQYPLWLYHNDGKGGFSDGMIDSLGGRDWSTSGGLVSDFEPRDGYLDIFINDWATLGQKSAILYGPDFKKITELPNNVDHHGTFWEVGNTYNRKFNEDYISSVYDGGTTMDWGVFNWTDSCPAESKVEMAVRIGNTPKPDNSWSGWVPATKGQHVPANPSRYIQYKAHLSFGNPANLPVLFETRMTEMLPAGKAESPVNNLTTELRMKGPNPCRGGATIEYAVGQTGPVSLKVYDVTGAVRKIIIDKIINYGIYKLFWEAKDLNNRPLSAGVYFIRLENANRVFVKRVIVAK